MCTGSQRATDLPLPDERSRALWRRQFVLTLLVAASFALVVVLSGRVDAAYAEAVARRRLHLPVPDHSLLTAALVGTAALLVVLLAVACLHAYRIAKLSFATRETD